MSTSTTDDLPRLIDAGELAARYGRSRRWVLDKARESWPHIVSGRQVKFTAEQVAVIDQMQTVTPKAKDDAKEEPAETWGRLTKGGK